MMNLIKEYCLLLFFWEDCRDDAFPSYAAEQQMDPVWPLLYAMGFP